MSRDGRKTPPTLVAAAESCAKKHRTENPTDVLAVVLLIVSSNNVCRITVCDESTATDGKDYAVLIFDKAKRDFVLQIDLQRGDIVRFNALVLARSQIGEPNSVVFRRSFQSTELGFGIYRLGQCGGQSCFSSFDIGSVPKVMRISRGRYDELESWYVQSSYFVQVMKVPRLPCQFRSLEEVKSSLGVVSHVIVDVVDIESSAGTPRTRRKCHIPRLPTLSPTIVMLSDNQGSSIVAFQLDHASVQHKNFASVIKQALKLKCPLCVTHVVAKSNSYSVENYRSCSARQTIILPTLDTTVSIASEAQGNLYRSRRRLQFDHPATTCISQCEEGSIYASLLEIEVKGIKISARQLPNVYGDVDLHPLFACDANGTTCYNDVTLTLQDTDKASTFEAKGDGDILMTLCGGINVDDWSRTTSEAHSRLVHRLIFGLLSEEVELQWIVKASKPAEFRIENVSLPYF